MLKLTDITKVYQVGDNQVHALKGVDLEFRSSEFVSILGPSGCGKTTMLNLIGGLDAYTTGDLLIEGKSTKQFKHKDWDAYRNETVGFVFQSYNLIGHQTVLDNVAIALTLSGVSAKERKIRATEALEKVGLADQLHKKPNQLSGGQMQRVAIARATVNNPKILMADEPTGALDSKTSVQIMELLKEISKDRLVITVTHNPELAKQYSNRIINLFDGKVVSDTNPAVGQTHNTAAAEAGETAEKMVNKRTSMSFFTATKLSFKNLLTKKKRTILTSIAGSIGIMGVALVLAISSGMAAYTNSLQRDMAHHPLMITRDVHAARQGGPAWLQDVDTTGQFPGGNEILLGDAEAENITHRNVITQNFRNYLQREISDANLGVVTFSHGMAMNVLTRTSLTPSGFTQINTLQGRNIMGVNIGGQSHFHELPDNRGFILEQYDILYGRFPQNANELVLVVDSFNRIDMSMLREFGIAPEYSFQFSDFMYKEFSVIPNNSFFQNIGGVFRPRTQFDEALWNSGRTLEIVGIMRVKEDAPTEMLSHGVHHTAELTQLMLTDAAASYVAVAQTEAGTARNVLTGSPFDPHDTIVTFDNVMLSIGANTMPTGVQIFPSDFAARGEIRSLIRAYNAGREEAERIIYTDPSADMVERFNEMIGLITVILTVVAALALVVSTIMIGIITYVSVVERTKEIGILRAIGARKKDVSRIFNAETLLIGLVSGVIGVVLAYLLSIPVNLIIGSMMGVAGIAALPFYFALLLVAGSMALTLLGGFIPARGAAKKDPVIALRSE